MYTDWNCQRKILRIMGFITSYPSLNRSEYPFHVDVVYENKNRVNRSCQYKRKSIRNKRYYMFQKYMHICLLARNFKKMIISEHTPSGQNYGNIFKKQDAVWWLIDYEMIFPRISIIRSTNINLHFTVKIFPRNLLRDHTSVLFIT